MLNLLMIFYNFQLNVTLQKWYMCVVESFSLPHKERRCWRGAMKKLERKIRNMSIEGNSHKSKQGNNGCSRPLCLLLASLPSQYIFMYIIDIKVELWTIFNIVYMNTINNQKKSSQSLSSSLEKYFMNAFAI